MGIDVTTDADEMSSVRIPKWTHLNNETLIHKWRGLYVSRLDLMLDDCAAVLSALLFRGLEIWNSMSFVHILRTPPLLLVPWSLDCRGLDLHLQDSSAVVKLCHVTKSEMHWYGVEQGEVKVESGKSSAENRKVASGNRGR